MEKFNNWELNFKHANIEHTMKNCVEEGEEFEIVVNEDPIDNGDDGEDTYYLDLTAMDDSFSYDSVEEMKEDAEVLEKMLKELKGEL